ncbi:MAG: DUF4102 domain-containing protein, partial [Rhodobacteraceae bacterium]|nr:DUF4102 domain-containing protein [Paracoccaceae bacterium]
MGKVKLTKAAVERIEPVAGQQLFVWDTTLRGFGLRVSAGGAKTYIMQRRVGTLTRRISIGRADDLTPERARKSAEGLAAKFAEGVDPVRERRREERSRLTLRQAFRDYIAAPVKKGGGKGAAKKPRTVRDIEKQMEAFADWLDQPVGDVKPSMVKKRHG